MNECEKQLIDKNRVQKYFIKMGRINGISWFAVLVVFGMASIFPFVLVNWKVGLTVLLSPVTLYTLLMPLAIRDDEDPSRGMML